MHQRLQAVCPASCIAILFSSVAICGCSTSECDSDQGSKCRGSTLMECICVDACGVFSGEDRWAVEEYCDGACVTGHSGAAFCAKSSTPEPACGQHRNVCLGSVLMTCREGFVIENKGCRGVCLVDATNEAFCALSAVPEPACDGKTVACDGPRILKCRDGLATDATRCDSTMQCRIDSDGEPFCGFDPDPACMRFLGSGHTGHSCAGDKTLVTCREQYVERREDCLLGCGLDDMGQGECVGSYLSRCKVGADCEPGFACLDNGGLGRRCVR